MYIRTIAQHRAAAMQHPASELPRGAWGLVVPLPTSLRDGCQFPTTVAAAGLVVSQSTSSSSPVS